jgi:TATA-binding protein-associated factor
VWDGLVKILEIDLFSPAWEVRHGAAMALRELLKAQGKFSGTKGLILLLVLHTPKFNYAIAGASLAENDEGHGRWCNALAAKLLCVFILDRFGDFVSDQVVAPVRETVSQTLASLLLHMPRRSVLHVHSVLLQMIRQDFTLPTGANGPGKEKSHIWEVRHAGLLGIKYEVAVRSDVVEAGATNEEVKIENNSTDEIGVGIGLVVKAEKGDEFVGKADGLDANMEDIQEKNGIKIETLPGPRHILQDVVDAAVLGQVEFLFLFISAQ